MPDLQHQLFYFIKTMNFEDSFFLVPFLYFMDKIDAKSFKGFQNEEDLLTHPLIMHIMKANEGINHTWARGLRRVLG